MTFTLSILARDIQAAVSACAQIVDASSKIPILRTTRISVEDGIASFLATSIDQTITARAPCEGDGVACIDTQALAAKVNALRADQQVNFGGDGKFVTITQSRTKWKVPVLLDDFPVDVAKPVEGEAVEVGKEFIAALKAVQSAALVGASNSYGAVWIDGDRIAAADGKQLRAVQIPDALKTTLLPPSVIADIISMFPNGATVTLSDTRAQFASGNLTLVSRLVEGHPMDWRRAIPGFETAAVNSCIVDAGEFSAAIRRASSIRASGEKAGAYINLQLRFRQSEVEILTRNADGEEGSDACACEREGSDSDVGLNGGALIANVETLGAGTIRIRYGTERDPLLIDTRTDAMNLRAIMPRAFS